MSNQPSSQNDSHSGATLFTRFFISLGQYLLSYPKIALFIIFALLLTLMSGLPRLTIDTSAEGFLYEDAEPILRYDAFRKVFGRDEFFVVAITGVDVFSLEFLNKLYALHTTLEQRLERLQDVESLVNARSIYGIGDELIAEDLLEELPTNAQELAILKQRVQSKPVYYNYYINHAENAATIMVKLVANIKTGEVNGEAVYENLSDEEIYAVYEDLLIIIDEVKGDFEGAEIYIGGTQAIGSYMGVVLQEDFGQFTVVALLMVMMFLWLMFRRVSAVLIPICVMMVCIISCISLMAWLGFPMQITSSILPSFLLAVCVGDSVHLLSIFFHHYDSGETKKAAILHAMEHTGEAVLFTTLTTAAGLLAFSLSEIRPVASLGLFAAVGSVFAFILTVFLVPVLLNLSNIKRHVMDSDKIGVSYHDATQMDEKSLIYRFTRACIHLSTTYPKWVVGIAVILMTAALTIAPNIRFAQDSLEWFDDENTLKIAVKAIEREITGSLPIEVMIDSGEAQGALNPEFLTRLDIWVEGLKDTELNGVAVVTASGLTTLLKETHQAMNGNETEFYAVPDSQPLIAQELLLIEMDQAKDLFQFVDDSFQKTRVTIIMPWSDATLFETMQNELQQSYSEAMGDLYPQYPMIITGVVPVFSMMFADMINSAANSYLFAFVVICIMMMLLLRSFVEGFISMLPNLLPIMLVLSYMTLVDIPLDVFTVLIGSIALGLCVDDTVHFMHGFKTAYARSNDTVQAIEETLFSTGKAMLVTTVVLCCGFSTFTLSELTNMDLFGSLTAVCIFIALIADFTIAPALMVLRYGIDKK